MVDPSAGRVAGFFHAGVTVSDMEASLRFYRDGLGLEASFDGESAVTNARQIWNIDPERVRVVFLTVPGSDAFVELFEFMGIERHPASARPCDYGAGHMCLFVADADALHERMVELGFRSRAGAVVTIEAGPHAGAKVAYLIDPDGYHVEVYEKAPDVRDIVARLAEGDVTTPQPS
jgi:catechol 2,3-dioxygenase-like lactoylglutathione lyase family enzyme